jgi:hypothetical protein
MGYGDFCALSKITEAISISITRLIEIDMGSIATLKGGISLPERQKRVMVVIANQARGIDPH